MHSRKPFVREEALGKTDIVSKAIVQVRTGSIGEISLNEILR